MKESSRKTQAVYQRSKLECQLSLNSTMPALLRLPHSWLLIIWTLEEILKKVRVMGNGIVASLITCFLAGRTDTTHFVWHNTKKPKKSRKQKTFRHSKTHAAQFVKIRLKQIQCYGVCFASLWETKFKLSRVKFLTKWPKGGLSYRAFE